MYLRPGSNGDRTEFEFEPIQINKSTPVDSDAELFGSSNTITGKPIDTDSGFQVK